MAFETKWKNTVMWMVTIFTAFMFVMSGILKLAQSEELLEAFHSWGYPTWFVFLVGLIEALCGIFLIFQRTATVGASALLILMVGAIGTHLISHEATLIGPAVMFAVFLVLILMFRKEA